MPNVGSKEVNSVLPDVLDDAACAPKRVYTLTQPSQRLTTISLCTGSLRNFLISRRVLNLVLDALRDEALDHHDQPGGAIGPNITICLVLCCFSFFKNILQFVVFVVAVLQ